jgi:hypothetical protein
MKKGTRGQRALVVFCLIPAAIICAVIVIAFASAEPKSPAAEKARACRVLEGNAPGYRCR